MCSPARLCILRFRLLHSQTDTRIEETNRYTEKIHGKLIPPRFCVDVINVAGGLLQDRELVQYLQNELAFLPGCISITAFWMSTM